VFGLIDNFAAARLLVSKEHPSNFLISEISRFEITMKIILRTEDETAKS
jgi:hypothetical protein